MFDLCRKIRQHGTVNERRRPRCCYCTYIIFSFGTQYGEFLIGSSYINNILKWGVKSRYISCINLKIYIVQGNSTGTLLFPVFVIITNSVHTHK